MGSAGLVKAGAGLLNISGMNTYGGNTTITGGTLQLAAGGTINNAGQIIVGGPGGATFNLSGGTVTTSNSGYALYVGQNSGQPGAVNISGGALAITGTIALGDNGNATYNQTGGVVNVTSALRMCNNPSSTAVATITGGSLTTGGIIVTFGGTGQINGGTGTMTIGGNAMVTTPYLAMAGYTGNTSSSAGLGTLNLNGGTLTTHSVSLNVNPFNFTPQSIWGTGVFNFNGGVLQSSSATTSFMTGLSAAYVQSGGANIFTNFSDTISQSLLHDPNLTVIDGGLTKTGSGKLTLSGTNTFNGPTIVSSGTLAVANALALQNSTLNSAGGGAISFSATTPSATFGGLTGSGNLTGPSGTLSIGNNGASTIYTGALSGSGALAKLGNGMLTLAGAKHLLRFQRHDSFRRHTGGRLLATRCADGQRPAQRHAHYLQPGHAGLHWLWWRDEQPDAGQSDVQRRGQLHLDAQWRGGPFGQRGQHLDPQLRLGGELRPERRHPRLQPGLERGRHHRRPQQYGLRHFRRHGLGHCERRQYRRLHRLQREQLPGAGVKRTSRP